MVLETHHGFGGIFILNIMKRCNHCKIEKELMEFCKNKRQNDGVDKRCKKCCKIFSKRYRDKPKEIPTYKICKICSISKNSTEYHKKSTSKDGLCKICRKPITKKYNSENSEKVKQSNIKWKKDNPDYKFNSSKYSRDRKKRDPLFKLRKNIGSLILMTFKNSKTNKAYRTMKILGCSIEDFRKHIENQFLEWMTWDNHGGNYKKCNFKNSWDLDHIIPVSFAKTEEEVHMLNHYSNFQPLCSKVNRTIKLSIVPILCNVELEIDTQDEKINKLI